VGKKKNKVKDKDKAKLKDNDRPGRKELARDLERLQAENEALRARLERIAEIAASHLESEPEPQLIILDASEQA
jgi:hypothetical protein